MNHLIGLHLLKNNYFVLRHGKSVANVQEIILSNPNDGTRDYGLVEEGKTQVKNSVEQAMKNNILNSNTIIISSDFTRARETSEIAKEILGVKEITYSAKLRERFFGNWDKKHNKHYQDVWKDDRVDPHHKNNNVESTSEVIDRTTALIKELEDKYFDKNILLVSHGDALQILQTAFERVASSKHRELSHLQTAEIRKLQLA